MSQVRRSILFVVVGGLTLAVAVFAQPLSAVVLIGLLLVVAVSAWLGMRLTRVYLAVLGTLLLGYAFLGRGFAHLGRPPVYVGELVLFFGLIASGVRRRHGGLLRSPLIWLTFSYMIVGALDTLPYLHTHGLHALRDGVLWGYATYALLVAGFMVETRLVRRVIGAYGRILPWFLLWVPFAVALRILASSRIPRVPGANVPLIDLKGGDIAVHLAGVLAFMVAGVGEASRPRAPRLGVRDWLIWALWLGGCISVFSGRSALLTVLAVLALLVLLKPFGRWAKLAILTLILAFGFVSTNVQVNLGERPVSARAIVVATRSIFTATGNRSYDSTRKWRLKWWSKIVHYTVFGRYFWTGKGFGINLADADGFQVTSNDSLRAPHNSHLDILARGGVPLFALWVLLQGAFAFGLVRGYFRARAIGLREWARIDLWLLAYWLAFMTNASFDVYLEGPQGGIWFWSMFGLGIAVLELQRRGNTAGRSASIAARVDWRRGGSA